MKRKTITNLNIKVSNKDDKDWEEESKEETKDSIDESNEEPIKYSVLTLDQCKTGDNSGGVFVCKLISHLKKEQEVPLCFLVVDSKFKFWVLSLYNLNNQIEKLKFGDTLMVRDPKLLRVNVKYKQSVLSYLSIQVTDICNILINKKPLSEEVFNPELVTETFTEKKNES